MLQLVMQFYYEAQKALSQGADFDEILKLPIRDDIARFKFVAETRMERWFDQRKKTARRDGRIDALRKAVE